MNNKEKFVLFGTMTLLIFVLLYCVIMSSLRYTATIILGVAILFVLIYLLLEKFCGGFSTKTRGIVVLTQTLLFGLFVYHLVQFFPFPYIVSSPSRNKIEDIQHFLSKSYGVESVIHVLSKDSYSLELLTYSHRVYDKIALRLTQDDYYSQDMKIAAYYTPSSDTAKSKKRFEKALNNRFKLIKGVKSVDTKINAVETDGKIDVELSTFDIRVKVSGKTDMNELLTSIHRSLPVLTENVKVTTYKE